MARQRAYRPNAGALKPVSITGTPPPRSPRRGDRDRGFEPPLRAAGAKSNFQIAQLTLGRARRLGFDGTVFFNQSASEWRQRRAAAARAAWFCSDDLLAEATVEIVNQKPGPPIGHAERPARLRDRAGFADGLQEPDLAGAERPVRTEIDAHRQPYTVHGYLATRQFRAG